MRRARGYALLIVLILSAILAASLAGVFLSNARAVKANDEMLARKKAFHAADGMSRAVVTLSNSYLRNNPNATSAELASSFTPAVLDSITPSGYIREFFDVSTTGRVNAPVPSGTFSGMPSRQFPVTIAIKLRSSSTEAAAAQKSTVVLAQIAAFQFFLLSDGYTDWFPEPISVVKGRSHVNGDFCIGGMQGFAMERVTASGRIMQISDDTRCRRRFSNRTRMKIAKAFQCVDFPTTSEFTAAIGSYPPGDMTMTGSADCTLSELNETQDSGCLPAECPGGWAAFATATWGDNVSDIEHGTVSLKLPITGQPKVLSGVNAGVAGVTSIAGSVAQESNRANSRLLVDPLLPSEPIDVVEQKMMYKADIRIVNGVWFLRNPANPRELGTPIWSDHPGSHLYVPSSDGLFGTPVQVGQADLAAAHGWGAAPTGYSYYETDLGAGNLLPNNSGVISYGTLFRAAANNWRPGFRMISDGSDAAGDEVWCTPASVANFPPTSIDATTVMRDATVSVCGVPVQSQLLMATTSGFKDGHAVSHAFDGVSTGPQTGGFSRERVNRLREARAKMLPINFDVAAFQAALQNTASGELGSYFVSRPFNGIVYVTSVWPGMNDGYSDTEDVVATSWPDQGTVVDASQVALAKYVESLRFTLSPSVTNLNTSPAGVDDGESGKKLTAADMRMTQQALPRPLCSTSFAGRDYDIVDTDAADDTRFQIPRCADYAAGGPVQAHPNALRIFNSANINPAVLPRGLSIVTNLPLYVMGDTNTSSNPATATSTPWVPMMTGGDMISHLSAAFDDDNSHWGGALPPRFGFDPDGAGPGTGKNARIAIATTFNTCVLAGWAVTPPNASSTGLHGGGIQNFTRYHEDWGGGGPGREVAHVINGAFLVSHQAVYTRNGLAFRNTSFDAPVRDWTFDPHLEDLDNQPPGAPEFNIHAVRQWQRE